jgi:hypothetical protein
MRESIRLPLSSGLEESGNGVVEQSTVPELALIHCSADITRQRVDVMDPLGSSLLFWVPSLWRQSDEHITAEV